MHVLSGIRYLKRKSSRWIAKLLPSLSLAFELAYGRLPVHGKQRNIALYRYIKTVARLPFEGFPLVKKISDFWRRASLAEDVSKHEQFNTHATRGVSQKRLFLASTLSRGCDKPTTKAQVAASCKKAEERWLRTPPNVSPQLLEELSEFAKDFFGKPAGTPEKDWNGRRSQSSFPVPGRNACLGTTAKDGGLAYALHNVCRLQLLQEDAEEQMRKRTRRGWAPNQLLGQALDAHNVKEEGHDRTHTVPISQIDDYLSDPEKLYQVALRRVIRQGYTRPEVKPVGIHEIGNKIRVASLHPPELVHVSRTLNQRLIEHLKRHRMTREQLENEPIKLSRERGGTPFKVYSADWSAASDYVPHSVAQTVMHAAAEAQNWSREERIAIPLLFGKMDLLTRRLRGPHGEASTLTSGGVHMGLSGTWSILCCLNAFCAYKAFKKNMALTRRATAVCGDDLVALFTPHERTIYDQTVTDIGLVNNVAKSHYSHNGVFCERPVVKDLKHSDRKEAHYTCLKIVSVAECCGMQTQLGLSNNPLDTLGMLGSITKNQGLYAAQRNAAKTASRQIQRDRHIKLLDGLPASAGGNNLQVRDKKRVAYCLLGYLMKGPIRLSTKDKRVLPENTFGEERHGLPVTVLEAATLLTSGIHQRRALRGEQDSFPKPARHEAVRRTAHKYVEQGRDQCKKAGSVKKAMRALGNLLTAKGRYHVRYLPTTLPATWKHSHIHRLKHIVFKCRIAPTISLHELRYLATLHGIPDCVKQDGTRRAPRCSAGLLLRSENFVQTVAT